MHGHTFRTALPLKSWYNLLIGVIGNLVDHTEEDLVMPDDRFTGKSTTLEPQVKALHRMNAPGIYHGSL